MLVWQTGPMKRLHASDDVRARALAAVDGGHCVADIAAFYQNDPSTMRRWLRQRARIGSGLSRPRSGRPRLLGVDDDTALQAQVVSHPDATLAEHCRGWEAAHGMQVSPSTMRRALLRLGITLKQRP